MESIQGMSELLGY